MVRCPKKLKLKAIRANMEMSQEEFSSLVNINFRRYQDLENGKRKLLGKELLVIAEKCNILPDQIEC